MALIRQRDSSHAFTTLLTPFSKDGVVDYRALKTSLDRQIDAGLVAFSGLAAVRLPGPVQVQTLHRAFRVVLRLPAGLRGPHLSSP